MSTWTDSCTRQARRRWLLGGLVAGGLFTSLAAIGAGMYGEEQPYRMHRAGFGHHGWTGRDMSPEAVKERIDFMTDWSLTRVGASEEQRGRVKAIMLEAANDLAKSREQHIANRKAFVAALKEPTLDRAALESLRQAEMQLADQASNRMLKAIADAAEVLTPDQRAQLADRMARWRRGV